MTWCIVGWFIVAFLLGGLLGAALRRSGREERPVDRADLVRRLEDLRTRINEINEGFEEILRSLRGS